MEHPHHDNTCFLPLIFCLTFPRQCISPATGLPPLSSLGKNLGGLPFYIATIGVNITGKLRLSLSGIVDLPEGVIQAIGAKVRHANGSFPISVAISTAGRKDLSFREHG